MEETPDLEQRRSPWQTAVAVAVIVLTLAVVFGLVAYRYYASQPHRVTGAVLGNVQVAPGFNVKCSLPITAYGRTAAMISFPDGAVTVDNSVKPPADGGKPYGAYSFDVQLQKWVPVQRQWVAPDGKSYAFSTTTMGVPGEPPAADVRIRDAVTGHDRTVWKGQGNANLIGWSGNTLYFNLQPIGGMQPAYGPEVWGVDANGANLKHIGPNPPPPAPEPGKPYSSFFGGGTIGGGAIWSVTASKAFPSGPPTPGAPTFSGPDTISRMDLGTGAVSAWYTAPDGNTVTVIGLDEQGRPIISQIDQSDVIKAKMNAAQPPPGWKPPTPSYFILTTKGQALPISVNENSFGLGQPSSDSHGTWFSAPGQIWLLRSGKLTKVADVPEQLFPAPTPPPGAAPMPKPATNAAIQMPMQKGPYLQIAGACA